MSEEIKLMHELLNELNDNLKKDCCALGLKIKPINFLIKLYVFKLYYLTGNHPF